MGKSQIDFAYHIFDFFIITSYVATYYSAENKEQMHKKGKVKMLSYTEDL